MQQFISDNRENSCQEAGITRSGRLSLRNLSVLFLLVCLAILASCSKAQNKHIDYTMAPTPEQGILWPDGQALPQFALPAGVLYGLDMRAAALSPSEKAIYSSLQGLVNKNKPRIILFDQVREGNYKWPNKLGLTVKESTDKWSLLRKYQNEVSGIILYDRAKSNHYLNLATTIGGLKNALPVATSDWDTLKANGFNFQVLEDISNLTYTTAPEIYQYLYENYWGQCTKRLLVSLNPRLSGYIRDIGIASGSALVWLDPRKEEEEVVLRKFLADMKAGESIMIGWWAEERSGIGIGTQYGISTIPADYYENTTVYAGMSNIIQLPAVPKKPKLENKVYLAIFLSDGDNVQYCQHAMSMLWDNENRGVVPINWTVSPGLVDMGPGLLNYYYATATQNDFFASGPSGLGYALIYDAHNEKWNVTDPALMDAYTRFTQQYLEKSGLRIITIWDEINEDQMDIYTTNCRYLYGVTLEDWERSAPLQTVIKQEKLAFMPNHPCYASKIEDIYVRWEKKIRDFDGSKPMFLAAQGVSWEMGPENIVRLKEMLEELLPNDIVICRGDHFFTLFNEAHDLYFNLTMNHNLVITSSESSTRPEFAANGSPSGDNQWISSGSGDKWIQFDFQEEYLINRYVVRHAGTDGMDPDLNTRSFRFELSTDGVEWKTASQYRNNNASVTDTDITPVNARYARLSISDAGRDGIARIGDMEVYGKRISE